MSVVIESSKPLEELIDPKYPKSKRHGPAKRMLDSLLWASENLLLCVVREKDGDGAEMAILSRFQRTCQGSFLGKRILGKGIALPFRPHSLVSHSPAKLLLHRGHSGTAIAGRSDRSRALLGTGLSSNGIFFESAELAASRARHARPASPPMKNAIANRSGRSERRRESNGLANEAFSRPGACGRTTRMTTRPVIRQPQSRTPTATVVRPLVRPVAAWTGSQNGS
jgi:hypothetical protein